MAEEKELEKNYKVKERFIGLFKKYRCVEKILSTLKAELKSYEDSWSGYSSDCLGHAIIFSRLMIGFIERNLNQSQNLFFALTGKELEYRADK